MSEIRDETGAQRGLGYVIDVGRGDGSARCWLDVTSHHTNRHGVLHGGIASLLLDSAMGATGSLSVDPEGRAPFLTVSLTTQFLAPARDGTRVTATGRITGGGRSLLFIAGELVADDGTTIATASGVFKRVPPRAG
ncbi:PaaI family thioesterase [Roseivivax marinus]|uniref:PaaI family thioesterase n=1 Tax=Roseivivax marinus TaxID=1379903 RepID=UPI00273FA095|nr:PaaI family thioesterase [Roseivivax marinus]